MLYFPFSETTPNKTIPTPLLENAAVSFELTEVTPQDQPEMAVKIEEKHQPTKDKKTINIKIHELIEERVFDEETAIKIIKKHGILVNKKGFLRYTYEISTPKGKIHTYNLETMIDLAREILKETDNE